jgi:AcrR family transcriptional regulator
MSKNPPHIHDNDPAGKALILNAGLRLFATNGLSVTTIRDIAAATGLSNPALYKHFKTKHDLALVLFERLYRAHLNSLAAATRSELDFPSQFRAFITTYLEAYDDHPHATMFTTDNFAALWPDMPKPMKNRTVISLLRDLLESGRKEGFVNPNEDIDLQISLVVGMLGQVTRQLYFRALSGPATKHVDGTERLLRSGLS